MKIQKLFVFILSLFFFVTMPRSSLKRKRAFTALDKARQEEIKNQENKRENTRTRKHKSRDKKSKEELDR